jgi:hypothetical protein
LKQSQLENNKVNTIKNTKIAKRVLNFLRFIILG